MKSIYCLDVIVTIEYEFENSSKYFFYNQDQLNDFKRDFIMKHTNADGNYIPNITSIDFEQKILSLDELKHVATISDIENLTGFVIDISSYFLNDN